jgi:lipoprotein-anchoring transpeptidase ErfK/SrfK
MKRAITRVLTLAGGLALLAASAHAQSGWSEQGPVFGSEVKQRLDQEEAARAERRKSYGPVVYPRFMDGGERPDIKPVEPQIVYFGQNEEVGSIIIDTQARSLYFVLPDKKAYHYPISVGRDGFTWSGTERISRIAAWPSWTPPPEMHKRQPGLPVTVSGGMRNPQGARALYLGSTIYRIHGTNNDRTVGRANSSGCFRLRNEHVVHLASIAKVGTKVKVLQAYNGAVSESAPMASIFSLFGGNEPPEPPAAVKKKPVPKPARPAQAAPAKPIQAKASPSELTTASTPAQATPAVQTAPAPQAEAPKTQD